MEKNGLTDRVTDVFPNPRDALNKTSDHAFKLKFSQAEENTNFKHLGLMKMKYGMGKVQF